MNANDSKPKSNVLAHLRVMAAIAAIWWLRSPHVWEGTRWLNWPLFHAPLWQYFASALYVLLAFWASKLIDQLVAGQLRKWTAKTETKVDDILLELAHGPTKVISFVLILHVGLELFNWPERAEKGISTLSGVLIAVSLTYLALKLIDAASALLTERAARAGGGSFDNNLISLIRKTGKAVLLVVAILVTADTLKLFDIKALLASLSVGGLALGLAAQDTLGNLFGAVSVFIDKPFRVGDRVKIADTEGFVEEVGLRSTRIRNLEGFLVSVPNKTMVSGTIINITRRLSIQTVMNIGLTYDTSVERVKRAVGIIEEVARKHPLTSDVLIAFNKFEADSLNISVTHWSSALVQRQYLAGLQEMNLEIKRRFDEERIEFAFPTQTLHIKQDSARSG